MKLVRMLLVTVFMASILSLVVFADDLNGLHVPMNEDCPNSWRYEDGVRKEIEKKGRPEIQPFTMIPEEAKAVGIDVSEHNDRIDWEMVKENIDFAILRCGYGSNYTSQDDEFWSYNVKECERLDIPYGVYLYSYALSSTQAESEANHVLRLLEGHHPSLPVFYDLEEEDRSTGLPKCSNAQLLENTKIFCSILKREGYDVGVYANRNWWNNFLIDYSYNQWERWVADYSSMCKYTGEFTYWQYTESGTVPGIHAVNSVDMNYSRKEISIYDEEDDVEDIEDIDDIEDIEDGDYPEFYERTIPYFVRIICKGVENSEKKYLGTTESDNVELMEAKGYETVWCVCTAGDSAVSIANLKNGKELRITGDAGVGTNLRTGKVDYYDYDNWKIKGNMKECEIQLQKKTELVVDIDFSSSGNQGNAQLGNTFSSSKKYQKFTLEEIEFDPIVLSYEQNGAEVTFSWNNDQVKDIERFYLVYSNEPYSYVWHKVTGLNSKTILLQPGYHTAQVLYRNSIDSCESEIVELYVPDISDANRKSAVSLDYTNGVMEVTVTHPEYAIEHGILVGNSSGVECYTEGRQKIVFTELDSNNKFFYTPEKKSLGVYKAYVIYDSGSGKRIAYSDYQFNYE